MSLSLHDKLLAADVAVSTSGAIRVLAVTGSEPSKVIILTVSGNPTVLRPDGALSSHLYSAATCSSHLSTSRCRTDNLQVIREAI